MQQLHGKLRAGVQYLYGQLCPGLQQLQHVQRELRTGLQ
jgi:hypothetical protein